MARLSDYRSDTRAINDGVWVRVGPEYDDLEILTRGFTDTFLDAQEARLTKAAQSYDADRAKIPNAERRTINAGLLEEFIVLDVRNLKDENEKLVEIGDFHHMLYEPEYGMLSRACWTAAGRVSTMSAAKLKAVMGNLGASSGSTSTGDHSAPA